MTASGSYQAITGRGRQCGVEVSSHRFRHYFSHAWLDRGGAEGDLMELKAGPPQMPAATAPAPAPPRPPQLRPHDGRRTLTWAAKEDLTSGEISA